MKFDLAKIQSLWTMIAGIILALNLTWVPEWLKGLASPDGSALLWAAVAAVVALVQGLDFRTGKQAIEDAVIASEAGVKPSPLVVEKSTFDKAMYVIIPVWPAQGWSSKAA